MVLEEYAELFAYCGTWAMLPFFVCPLVACWNIIKHGCSDFFPPNTFLDGLLRSILLYYHGKLLMSKVMMQQNLFGIILQLIYLTLYYFYLQYKTPFHREAAKSGVCIVITLLYVKWESPSLAPRRFGYILTLLNLSTTIYPLMGVNVAPPLHSMKDFKYTRNGVQRHMFCIFCYQYLFLLPGKPLQKYILTTKSTYGVPYMIIVCGQVVTTFWLLFAISVHNYIFMLQMLIPFVLGAVQIMLYFKYPSTPPCLPTEVNQEYTIPNIEAVMNSNQSDSIKYRKKRLAELRRRKINEVASQRDTNKVNLQSSLIWAEDRGK